MTMNDTRDAMRYRWLRDRVKVEAEGALYMLVSDLMLHADPPSVSPLSDAEQFDKAIDDCMGSESP